MLVIKESQKLQSDTPKKINTKLTNKMYLLMNRLLNNYIRHNQATQPVTPSDNPG